MGKKQQDTYEEAKEQGTTLESFVIPQRITAFVEAYQPCTERTSTNTFTETDLRNFFKAWPTSLGDPLSNYLEKLEVNGFKLQVSQTGELAIFTVERTVGSSVLGLLEDNSNKSND